MLKLVRNTIGRSKILYDDNNEKIQWKYFEELERYRSEKGYTLTHKLTKKHIQWYRAPMRVYLATQTLSKSVADSMEFLMHKGKCEFLHCAATIRFVRIFNDLFDVLNSKEMTQSMHKSSVTPANYSRISTLFENAIKYIKALKLEPDGKHVLFSRKRTAFRGLIIDMVNIQSVCLELIASKTMQSLPTFRFSQDPLEALCGRIRSLNGYNDNPNEQQFCAAIRKLTVNTEIICSSFSNCTDSLNILTVSSCKPVADRTNRIQTRFGVIEYLKYIEENKEIPPINFCENMFDSLENCSVAFVAGTIEQKIKNCELTGRFSCHDCKLVLSNNEKIQISFNPEKSNIPCKSTYEICAIAEKHFKAVMYELNFDYNILMDSILRDISFEYMYAKSNFENHVHHKFFIIEFIVEEFIRIQVNYAAKKATLNEQQKMLRSQLKKMLHNLGQ